MSDSQQYLNQQYNQINQQISGDNIVGFRKSELEEKNQDKPNLWKIFIFELLGTILFAHGINSSNGSDFLVAASLFAGIFLSCKHSGGHLNPAVSTAFLALAPKSEDELSQGIEYGTWIFYISAQVIGAFIGGFLAEFVIGTAMAPWIATQETDWILADMTGEMIGTFTFVLVILIMTDQRCSYSKQTIYIIATISVALFFSRQFTPHSGGCLNPAIALGLEFMKYFSTGQAKYLRKSYIYILLATQIRRILTFKTY
ncbi:Aquaporin-like protein [Pseudocohnilembus persalinus]|uniref:Aquaporin-like protein n=1 Tax=Pseudocohnilembus persalinus TaxID=266149 RepID=A0A0V0QII6_PSEPJ|nr:Aquaporin-like protein [Pseudocohnilembus persalinus]|eukprot:KRX01845.1 Aquaporin-like protein [Pseudocohnilembus persalinus]